MILVRKKIISGAVISVGIFMSSLSFAADLIIDNNDPVPFAPDEIIPLVGFDWSRFYGGLYVGYAQSRVATSNDFGIPFLRQAPTFQVRSLV